MRERRYPSDTTDHEWALIGPLLPLPASETARGGRPEKHPRREIVDAIRYVVDTGCKWRALPADFPPWRTVWGFMARWAAAGVISQIRDVLVGQIRREMGRGPRAVATIIDSQSVKAASTVGKDSRGYDAGKKINGRKRHIVVDTKGLPLMVMVTPGRPARLRRREGSPLPPPADAPRNHPHLGRPRLRGKARHLGKKVSEPHDQNDLPAQGQHRIRHPSPPLGRRTIARLDDERPPTRARLRAAHPALGDPHHLGRHHPHDSPDHQGTQAPRAVLTLALTRHLSTLMVTDPL